MSPNSPVTGCRIPGARGVPPGTRMDCPLLSRAHWLSNHASLVR